MPSTKMDSVKLSDRELTKLMRDSALLLEQGATEAHGGITVHKRSRMTGTAIKLRNVADEIESPRDAIHDNSIYSMFAAHFGQPPKDDTLLKLPVDSGCGAPCQRVIRGASDLLYGLREAVGDRDHGSPRRRKEIIDTVELIIEVFWRG